MRIILVVLALSGCGQYRCNKGLRDGWQAADKAFKRDMSISWYQTGFLQGLMNRIHERKAEKGKFKFPEKL